MSQPMVYGLRGAYWYVAEAGNGSFGVYRLTTGGHVRPCLNRIFASREEAQDALDLIAERRDMKRMPSRRIDQ